MFGQTSFFSQGNQATTLVHRAQQSSTPSDEATVSTKTLEDWSYYLGQAATEAHDEQLWSLESDLLDLRDAVLDTLHKHMLK